MENTEKLPDSPPRRYYQLAMRISEIYILTCFLLIIVLPLFEYKWVPGAVKTIYLTGAPLLLIIVFIGNFKKSIVHFFEKRMGIDSSIYKD